MHFFLCLLWYQILVSMIIVTHPILFAILVEFQTQYYLIPFDAPDQLQPSHHLTFYVAFLCDIQNLLPPHLTLPEIGVMHLLVVVAVIFLFLILKECHLLFCESFHLVQRQISFTCLESRSYQ